MHELCFLTGLSSSDWAAWVQAVGSIAAIFGAAGIAIWQAGKQHKTSLAAVHAQHRLARVATARALHSLSTNCQRAMAHAARQLPSREAVYNIAEGHAHFDLEELKVIEGAVRSIPLHTLPHQLVHLTMIVSSTVRQFRENVEVALQSHRSMDAAAFEKFFGVLGEMQRSLDLTCADIQAEVTRLESEV